MNNDNERSERKNIKIKRPYQLIKRGDRGGKYYMRPKNGGKTISLGTTDKDKAIELADAKCNHGDNENAMHHKKVAEAHLMKCNPEWVKNTWNDVVKRFIKAPRQKVGGKKKVTTVDGYESMWKNRAFDGIRNKRCIDTIPHDFIKPLQNAGSCAIRFATTVHNYAMKVQLIPYAVMGQEMWPAWKAKKPMSRAIQYDEHLRVVKLLKCPEGRFGLQAAKYTKGSTKEAWQTDWINYLWFLWWTGASNADAANMKAENIKWKDGIIEYRRGKWITEDHPPVRVAIEKGGKLEALLKKLPKRGYLFPLIQTKKSANRARFLALMCEWCKIPRTTIHGYRFAWAERSKEGGMSTEDRMANLGHQSVNISDEYARGANYIPRSIEIIDGGLKAA